MSTGLSMPLKGTGSSLVTLPSMSAQKSSLYNDTLKRIQPGFGDSIDQLSSLAGGGTQKQWDQLEAPALRQFGALQGDLASRFSQAGGRHSSGFQNTMSEAGAGLSEQLQSQRMKYQQDAQDRLMSLFQSLMGQDEFNQFLTKQKQKKNRFGGALSGAGQGAIAGSSLGWPGAVGGAIAGGVGGWFGG